MAWTMLARPHQSECFARTGRMHSLPIIHHTLIWNWNAVLKAFDIKGPCACAGTCFWRVFSMLDRKASMAFSHWGVDRCSGDVQKTDYGVSVIIVLQGLSLGLPLHRVSCVALFSGLHDSCHIFPGHFLRVLATCEVNGGVNTLHVACSGLYCLLPGGHDCYDLTDIVSVDAAHVL